jgi:hypothetical protein
VRQSHSLDPNGLDVKCKSCVCAILAPWSNEWCLCERACRASVERAIVQVRLARRNANSSRVRPIKSCGTPNPAGTIVPWEQCIHILTRNECGTRSTLCAPLSSRWSTVLHCSSPLLQRDSPLFSLFHYLGAVAASVGLPVDFQNAAFYQGASTRADSRTTCYAVSSSQSWTISNAARRPERAAPWTVATYSSPAAVCSPAKYASDDCTGRAIFAMSLSTSSQSSE